MKMLCTVFVLFCQQAVAAPVAYDNWIAYQAALQSRNLTQIGHETFEEFVVPRGDWYLPVALPFTIDHGMTLSAIGRGEAGISNLDNLDLGENQTPGGRQHFESRRISSDLATSLIITFPYPVHAFSFGWSGYSGWTSPDEIWNSLTAHYGGFSTQFPANYGGFFGVVSDKGLDSVQIEMVAIDPAVAYNPFGIEGTWGIDEIRFAETIPEPGAWKLTILGACLIFLSRALRN